MENFPDSNIIVWGEDTHRYVEYLTQVIKDFKRSIDYLETRKDIDSTRLAYYGISWDLVWEQSFPPLMTV
jgi:hypothetical protein